MIMSSKHGKKQTSKVRSGESLPVSISKPSAKDTRKRTYGGLRLYVGPKPNLIDPCLNNVSVIVVIQIPFVSPCCQLPNESCKPPFVMMRFASTECYMSYVQGTENRTTN